MDFNNINKSMNDTKDLLKNTASKISNKKSQILNNIKSSIPISNVDNLQTINQNSIINQDNNSNNITFLTVIKDFLLSKLIIIKYFLFNFIYSYKITITVLILIFIFSELLYKKFINFYTNTLDSVNSIMEKNIDVLNNSSKIINNITNISDKENNNTLESKLKSRVVTNKNVNDIVTEDLNNEQEESLEDNLVKNLNTESESKPITKIQEENNNSFDIDKLKLTKSNNNTNTGNEGWCYIGTSNNVRSCARVGKNNQCLSGEIFPSLDICRDPTLRE